MKPQQIAEAYDQITDVWRDENFSRDNGVSLHQKALSFLHHTGRSLNAGCGGNTRFNSLLRDRQLEIEGVDISSGMIELARASDPDATYHLADLCDWESPHTFEFITAWDSLWHVPLADQSSVMLKLMDYLSPGGVFIYTAGGIPEAGEHCDDAMGPEVYYSTLGIPGLLAITEAGGCILRHFELDQWPEAHLCMIVQKMS